MRPKKMSRAARSLFPPGMLWLASGIFLIAGIGPNIGLAVAATAVLLVGSMLLWRPAETPILLFIFCYQWLQASLSVFHANWNGVLVDDLSVYGADMQRAVQLSLIGLVML